MNVSPAKLDPRTKLFLVIVANSVILTASHIFSVPMVIVPAILLLFERKWKFVLIFFSLYLVATFVCDDLKKADAGIVGTLAVTTAVLLYRMMPVFALLYYVISTTRVNEFMAAMHRMHIPNKITIPLAVMIRFFPTLIDESRAIGNAMKMRGIRFFSLRTLKNPFTVLEYRFIPLLVSLTKIGDELSVAATTRGLSPDCKRTCIVPLQFHLQDFAVFLYCICVVTAYVLVDLLHIV